MFVVFFAVNGYEEVAGFMGKWVPGGGFYNIRTFDFATIYITLPHNDLIARMADVVNEAFDYESGTQRGNIIMKWQKGEYAWVRRGRSAVALKHTRYLHEFSMADVNMLINFIVTNTDIINAGIIRRRQIVGNVLHYPLMILNRRGVFIFVSQAPGIRLRTLLG